MSEQEQFNKIEHLKSVQDYYVRCRKKSRKGHLNAIRMVLAAYNGGRLK